jgi:hypothetical protein
VRRQEIEKNAKFATNLAPWQTLNGELEIFRKNKGKTIILQAEGEVHPFIAMFLPRHQNAILLPLETCCIKRSDDFCQLIEMFGI